MSPSQETPPNGEQRCCLKVKCCDGDSYRVEYFYDSGEELEDVLDEDGFSKLEFESDGCLELEYF